MAVPTFRRALRIGQVALKARDGQFGRQMGQKRIADAEIGLGVLKVDGVDFVRHGGRADFARNDALLEVAPGDISPDVLVKAQQ